MKKMLLPALFAGFLFSAEAQVKFPQPSPTQTISQNFGIGKVELTYSRPSVKNRKIFGDLVPYQKMWRTGANAAPKITFSDPVTIAGKKLDSGSYVIYTIPSEDSWEIILNKGVGNWGVDGYKESDDVLRTTVTPIRTSDKIETFTMQFENMKPESCDLSLWWDHTKVKLNINVDIKSKLKSQIEEAMKTDKKPYWEAAQFYTDYEKDNSKALKYITLATEANPKAYYMFLFKAKLQEEMGDLDGALKSSTTSLELAKSANNNDYIKLNEDFQKKLKKKK